jgi:nucleotide-binding universal stress UspA family protein
MPYPFRVILVPMQFDDPAQVALGVAKRIGKDLGATVHLLHVVPILPAIGEPHVAETVHAQSEQKARLELQQVADRELREVKHEIHTNVADLNDTAKAIIREAKQLDADLIVMKTHGRQGLAHLVIGSVAEEVVRLAPCMVLTLTSAAKERAARGQGK